MISYPSNYTGGQWTIQRGCVYKLEGFNSQGSQCLISLGNEKGWVPASSLSMIPANNPDYAQAARMYSSGVAAQNGSVAASKADQQAAQFTDAVKNPNVTVTIQRGSQ